MSNQTNVEIEEMKKETEEENTSQVPRIFEEILKIIYGKEQKIDECEKCGGETGVKLIRDESYDYCSDCNWMTN